MKSKIINIILTIAFALTGCAYYNTFYNAEQFFKKAAREREKRFEDMKKNANKTVQRDYTKPTGTELESYDKAIEKASNVLQFYPKSKYVDDALMLLGQCFYYRDDNLKAERKFEELLKNYPESEFRHEAKLWLARTYVQLEKYDEAKAEFHDIVTSRVPREIRDEALLAIGELYFIKEDYVTAAHEYLTAVKNVKDKTNRSKAALKMGECYFILKDYEKAIDGYQLAVKFSTDSDTENEATFQLAKSNRLLGQYDEAMKHLQKLLGRESFSEHWPMAKLEMANCIYLKDKATQKKEWNRHQIGEQKENNELYLAVEWLESIIVDHPRTEGAARAHYYLGKIYETDYALYDSAYSNYMQVKNHNRTSVINDSATARAEDIVQLLGLIEIVKKQTAAKNNEGGYYSDFDLDVDNVDESTLDDSTRFKLRVDRMLRRLKKFVFYNPEIALPDTLIADSLFADSLAMVDSIWVRNEDGTLANTQGGYYDQFNDNQFDENETEEERKLRQKKEALNQQLAKKIKELEKNKLIQNKLLLAEEYLFQFSNYDSALVQYESILSNFPDSSTQKIRPQILYTMNYIYGEIKQNQTTADSILKIIAENYPISAQGRKARELLNLPQLAKAEDLALDLFSEAEFEYTENQNIQNALALYKKVENKFPKSNYAPKSVYAAAWIYDKVLNENDRALDLYNELVEKYPGSEYAKQAQKSLDNYKREKEKMLAALKADSSRATQDSTLAATDSTSGKELTVETDSVKATVAASELTRPGSQQTVRSGELEGTYDPRGQFIPRTEPRRPTRILYLRDDD